MEYYADGFVRSAGVHLQRPAPAPGDPGRIFWDEEKIGDPTRSRMIVRARTGFTTEPDVLFQINYLDREVEWRRGEGNALIFDRRPGSATWGQEVDLESKDFNIEAREIWSAALPEDRASIRLSRQDYIGLPVSVRGRIEPDLEFWSSSQVATNGDLVPAPSGRPLCAG